MNGSLAALAEVDALIAAHPAPACEMLLCPPTPLIAAMAARAEGSALQVGGQDCHQNTSGAHTGDVSAAMLAEAGASHVILGHSERRADHGESSDLVRQKAEAALAAGLIAVVCLGETEAERDAGATLAVIGAQLDASIPAGSTAATVVIAYEPVWAIGTGRTPDPCTNRRGAWLFARAPCRADRGRGRRAAPALRRLGQTLECSRDLCPARGRRRACRRCQPQGRRFRRDCRGPKRGLSD